MKFGNGTWPVFKSLLNTLLRYPKPIICGLNGSVLGSGTALLLASDIVVAEEQATLQMPEAKLGLFSGIAAALLAFRIGTHRTAKILLSATSIESAEAKGMGIYHDIVNSDLVWARCQEIAKDISQGAHQSHQLAKQMINETIGEELFDQIRIGAANTVAARTTEVAIEGVTAFLEKRQPDW